MLSVIYAQCYLCCVANKPNMLCHYCERHYAKCRGALQDDIILNYVNFLKE
jgi:hypothetical protein